jgi:hypothetical protein
VGAKSFPLAAIDCALSESGILNFTQMGLLDIRRGPIGHLPGNALSRLRIPNGALRPTAFYFFFALCFAAVLFDHFQLSRITVLTADQVGKNRTDASGL